MFASEPMFDLAPDVITSAKGLTSGYIPLGASIFSDQIYQVISRPEPGRDSFNHGFTYSGHPVCCAAALKNIEIIVRDRICEHVRELGPYFEKRLARLEGLPLVGDVRGSHFMLCVESVANKQTKELLPEEVGIGERISDHCEKRGLIVRPMEEAAWARIRPGPNFVHRTGAFPKRIWQSGSPPGQRGCLSAAILAVRLVNRRVGS